jgi:hypothetical protein
MTRFLSAIALLAMATSAMATPTLYVFDSVSKFELRTTQVVVTGVLQGNTLPTTLTILDQSTSDNRHVVNRCMPVFLTMAEKTGRYLLHVVVDPQLLNVQLVSCGLELRS